MIRVIDLFKSFEGQHVLEGVNVDVADGEILVILGGSGSGKSVLLRHLIGLEKPDRGQVIVNGVDITRLSEPELLKTRRDIGYLFQAGALYDFFTVRENVAFPLREHTTLSWKEIWHKVDALLERVGLKEAKDKLPSELSGGMNKRAALARAVVMDSKVLLCDEPTSGLDPIRSREISDLIRDISRHLNSTTVVTSHDVVNALRIADKVVLIKDRKILMGGTPSDFRRSDNAFVKEFIGICGV